MPEAVLGKSKTGHCAENYTYVDYELSIAQENKKIKWAWQRGYGNI